MNGFHAGDLTTHSSNRTLALEQLGRLPHAPSVGLHDVPSESVGTHIGLKDYDELDERLARECSDPRYISRYSMAPGYIPRYHLTIEFNGAHIFPPPFLQNILVTYTGCRRQLETPHPNLRMRRIHRLHPVNTRAVNSENA